MISVVKMILIFFFIRWFFNRLYIADFNAQELSLNLLLIIFINYFGYILSQGIEHKVSEIQSYVLAGILAWLVWSRINYFLHSLQNPSLADIATTSLSAGDYFLKGINPYTVPVDFHFDFISPPYQFQGYKYTPLMMLIYLPLGHFFGLRGILFTNFIFDISIAVMLIFSAWRLRSISPALFAAILYLLPDFVAFKIYYQGSNDVVAVALALGGFLALFASPFWAGVLIGLSISTKLVPGLMFACIWGANLRKRDYLFGLICGFVPSLIFFLHAPQAFVENIFRFLFLRTYGTIHCWYSHLSPVLPIMLKGMFLLLLGRTCFKLWKRPCNFLTLCAVTVACSCYLLLATAVGANYLIWWHPFLVLLLSATTNKSLPFKFNEIV